MASRRQIEESIEDKKSFKQQDPARIIKRFLIMQHIHRDYTPDECEIMIPGTAAVEQLYDDAGELANFFNWEYILFEMPLAELEFMAERLYFQAEMNKKKAEIVSGIMNAQTQDEIDKKKIQGLTLSEDQIIDLKIEQANPGLVDKLGNPL